MANRSDRGLPNLNGSTSYELSEQMRCGSAESIRARGLGLQNRPDINLQPNLSVVTRKSTCTSGGVHIRAMNDSTREISPLRQRMMEDMRLRKLAPHTQASYVRAVRRLAGYLRRPPDTATVEELRNFQLHLVDRGTSPITLNATITGLKFFFDVTLDRAELMAKMKPVFVPRTLPVVLSREEVGALIALNSCGHTLGRNARPKLPFTRLTKIVVAELPAADS
jgi:Phage integrase, N-terminal SAM-like domain